MTKTAQVKCFFIIDITGWLWSEVMEQPAAATLNDLCTVVRQISLREMCRTEDYPEDGLIAIKNAVSDHLINAVSFSANQKATKKRLQNIAERLQDKQKQQSGQ